MHVDVDDVVAETFLVAWRRLDDIPEAELPWLIGVARNVRMNAHRTARRQRDVSRRLAESAEPAWSGDSGESEAVRTALGKLSCADREVLLLSVWDDLDRVAIAAVRARPHPRQGAPAATAEASPRASDQSSRPRSIPSAQSSRFLPTEVSNGKSDSVLSSAQAGGILPGGVRHSSD